MLPVGNNPDGHRLEVTGRELYERLAPNVPAREHATRLGRRGLASRALLDDQIAEAIDHTGLPWKQQRGGVELGEDGGTIDAGAGARAGARVCCGFAWGPPLGK